MRDKRFGMDQIEPNFRLTPPVDNESFFLNPGITAGAVPGNFGYRRRSGRGSSHCLMATKANRRTKAHWSTNADATVSSVRISLPKRNNRLMNLPHIVWGIFDAGNKSRVGRPVCRRTDCRMGRQNVCRHAFRRSRNAVRVRTAGNGKRAFQQVHRLSMDSDFIFGNRADLRSADVDGPIRSRSGSDG